MPVYPLGEAIFFPPVYHAEEGLLAWGGDLSPERLIAAYQRGVFPWYAEDEPILWWSPDPRMVIATAAVHVPPRLRRWLKSCNWTIRTDHAFAEVMRACAEPRHDGGGTWITEAMLAAYTRLHAEGHAHSLEVHDGAALIGGIYGIAIGRMFFGESMFSRREHASKVALLALCHGLATQGFPLLDAQVRSAHLETLGARAMPRTDFLCAITRLCSQTGIPGNWAGLFDHLRPQDLCRPIP